MVNLFIEFLKNTFDNTGVDLTHIRDRGCDLTDFSHVQLLHQCAAAPLAKAQKQNRRFLRARHAAVLTKGDKLAHDRRDPNEGGR